MSRIDELIQQLCPDGVEYKPLGDIMQIRRGASPRPIQEYITKQDDGIPWIKIGDVNPRSKFIVKTDQKITVSGAKKSCYLKKGDFILSNSMSFGRPYILAIDGCIHDGWIAMSNFERSFNSDFLFYLLRTQMIQKFWRQKASSGTVQNLNSDIVRDTSVPVPPLPVQEEIVRILEYMELHYSEPLSVADFAGNAGWSESRFSAIFREETGSSPMQFFNAVRLGRAQGFLLDGATVEEASRRSGFSSVQYFCRVFRKHTGVSPGSFRAAPFSHP